MTHNGYKNHITAEFVLVSNSDEGSYNSRVEVCEEALEDARNDLWYASHETYHDGDKLPAEDEKKAVVVAERQVRVWIDECIEAMLPEQKVSGLCDFAYRALQSELENIDTEQIAKQWVNEAVNGEV